MSKNLPEISANSDYWFIRTQGGSFFDEFVKSEFIAIGWNQITLSDLDNLNEIDLKEKIGRTNGWDSDSTKGKSLISQTYNKLIRFRDLKKDDFVVIPSAGAYLLAFAQVIDDKIYTVVENTPCDLFKRRRIKVLSVRKLHELDPKFYEIKTSRHSLSSINQYQDYIDRVTQVFYFKENYGNLVFDVKQDEDIPLVPLLDLISLLQSVMVSANLEFSLGENLESNIIKLNLQSRGTFALKVPSGKSLVIMGLAWTLSSCGSIDAGKLNDINISRAALDTFRAKKVNEFAKIDSLMRELSVADSKIHDQFK